MLLSRPTWSWRRQVDHTAFRDHQLGLVHILGVEGEQLGEIGRQGLGDIIQTAGALVDDAPRKTGGHDQAALGAFK